MGSTATRRPSGNDDRTPIVHNPTTPAPKTTTSSPTRGRPSSTSDVAVSTDGNVAIASGATDSGTVRSRPGGNEKWVSWGVNPNTVRPTHSSSISEPASTTSPTAAYP